MDERRTARVSEAVREELTEIIGFELDDPRLADVEVTDVHVSPDSRHATVKVAIHGDEKRRIKDCRARSRQRLPSSRTRVASSTPPRPGATLRKREAPRGRIARRVPAEAGKKSAGAR